MSEFPPVVIQREKHMGLVNYGQQSAIEGSILEPTTRSPKFVSMWANHATRCAFSVVDSVLSRSPYFLEGCKPATYLIIEDSGETTRCPWVRYGSWPFDSDL